MCFLSFLNDVIDILRFKSTSCLSFCPVSFLSLLILPGGGEYVRGENSQGQLGRGHGCNGAVPAPIRALRDKHIGSIWCGWRHAGMVTVEGDVWAWGNAKFHQLGLGCTDDQYHPRLVKGALSSHRVADVR